MGAPKLVLAPGTIYPCYVSGRSKFAKGLPKQAWRSRVGTWRLLKANALYWRKYLWHCWDFTAHPAVIRCPQQWFDVPIVIRRSGICCPAAAPVSRPWYHADLLQNHGLHCRGVTRGERGQNSNIITCTFFSVMHLLPKDLRFEHGGTKVASWPGRHLTSLRLGFTGSMPKTGFGCASFLNSAPVISFHCILIFIAAFPFKATINHSRRTCKKTYLHSSATSTELRQRKRPRL